MQTTQDWRVPLEGSARLILKKDVPVAQILISDLYTLASTEESMKN